MWQRPDTVLSSCYFRIKTQMCLVVWWGFFFTLCTVAYTNTETTAHPSLHEQSATAQTSRLKCPFRFLPSHLSTKWHLRCSWSSHRDCVFPFLLCISAPPPVLRGAKLRRRRPWRAGYLWPSRKCLSRGSTEAMQFYVAGAQTPSPADDQARRSSLFVRA